MSTLEPAGVYVHIPFCERKCPYCDFYSGPADEARMDSYTSALLRSLGQAPDLGSVDTLYFGGGTPNLLGPERLCALFDAVDHRYNLPKHAEITLEANPNSIGFDTLSSLVRQGFNRLSLGVQSLIDSELEQLGRLHSAQEAIRAVGMAQAAGFRHISIDLMVGLPGQTVERALESLQIAVQLPVDHVSVYLLKLEEGTPFRSKYGDLDDDILAEIYLAVAEALPAFGFDQYEISNFSKPGCESRHNLKYWRLTPYLGLGPSSHSFAAGRRRYFETDIHAFIDASNPFDLWVDDGPGGGPEEYIMLGLRLREGLSLQALAELGLDPVVFLARCRPLAAQGFLVCEGDRVRLTAKGFLLSNTIIVYLLDD